MFSSQHTVRPLYPLNLIAPARSNSRRNYEGTRFYGPDGDAGLCTRRCRGSRATAAAAAAAAAVADGGSDGRGAAAVVEVVCSLPRQQ